MSLHPEGGNPSKVAQAVALLTCIQKGLTLNPGQHTDNPIGFAWCTPAPPCKYGNIPYSKSLQISSIFFNLMFIGPCIILIVETNLMSLALLFLYLMLNMFRMY